MATRRTQIINALISHLATNTSILEDNISRNYHVLDEVNDFPAIYISAGTEIRDFNSKNLTLASLDATIRAYVFGEDNSQDLSDSLVQDIEHVIYSLGDNPDKGILDITIDNISTDEGLATPYGIAEVELTIVYRLDG